MAVGAARTHAVVIGAGVAGLCAARALSRSFDRVTVIERDHFPDTPQHRAGTPQSHHVHAFLLRGIRELERLFPGIEAELRAAGARPLDMCDEFAHCTIWGWARRGPTGVTPLTLSRVLIEAKIRERALRDTPNLTVLTGASVSGFKVAAERGGARVCGVLVRGARAREISADLVVDTSGRNSKALEWLAEHGVEPPEEEIVDSFAGYASRFYKLAPDPARWWRGMVIDACSPDQKRWGLIMPIENDLHVVTLGGINGEYPPRDEESFQAYLRSLISPALALEVARATPLSPIHAYRGLWNRARHFERWKHSVGGFVALGDSAIAYNPMHGQGMSMAAAAANALGDLCAAAPHLDPYSLTRRFHERQWKALRLAWNYATSIDKEWPGTTGKRSLAHRIELALGNIVLRASTEYPILIRLGGPVYQLVASPWVLLNPTFIGVVLFAELRRRLGRKLVLPGTLELSEVFPQSCATPPSEG